MYVTGMPGLGKTMCILQVVKDLINKYPTKLSQCYINSLKLSSPKYFFNHFWKFLTNNSLTCSKTCSNNIEELFKHGPTN